MNFRFLPTLLCVVSLLAITGCASTKTSNTARTAKEQMLVSNAVDRSLDKVDFSPLTGQNVFLDEKYLECVDKAYVVGSIRHRIMRAGGNLMAKPEEATVVMELRSGAVGTDTSESYLGTPEIALPGMLTVPEIRIIEKKSQFGYAKIGIAMYDASTKQILGEGGLAMAQADDNNVYAFGIGPFQSGSLLRDIDRAEYEPPGMRQRELSATVALGTRGTSANEPYIQFASDSKEAQ